ncbi:hypothetical protein [Vibrio splendidus]|uniref:hypothetical protein n=1 Tax=Vibrio splendidus TaxID=29497 RepID=UPI0002FE0D37|nr:hypothetical protein [Vibrio splendidus]OED83386.1 hypothetical protein A144_16460 [Vibrio splendidus ZF-90]OEF21016.1 hypothetical protein A145_04735 [Vibrio splendidus 5S-101]PMH66872.1 hypothetical protein BCU61_03835 [Vibrio splendidus]
METELLDYSNDIISLAEVNERCEKHIISNYSIGKQLTLERTGTDEKKLQMHTFIDACRTWANSEHPKVHELYEIQP